MIRARRRSNIFDSPHVQNRIQFRITAYAFFFPPLSMTKNGRSESTNRRWRKRAAASEYMNNSTPGLFHNFTGHIEGGHRCQVPLSPPLRPSNLLSSRPRMDYQSRAFYLWPHLHRRSSFPETLWNEKKKKRTGRIVFRVWKVFSLSSAPGTRSWKRNDDIEEHHCYSWSW